MLNIKHLFTQIKRKAKRLIFILKRAIFIGDNKVVFYSTSILLLIFVGVFILLFTLKNSEDVQGKQISLEGQKDQMSSISREQNQKEAENIHLTLREDVYTKPEGELSNLIQKANILYNNGRTKEALEIFESISFYSQTLANYNLGVIYIGEGNYSEAKKTFEDAIEGGDDVALSAINGAYSALKIKDSDSFNHFITLADQTLSDSVRSPFYSYLYSLVSFYKNQYFEALSPLLHPNSKNYTSQSRALATEMFLLLGDDHMALEQLKHETSNQNMLALGMLYARNGDYIKGQEKIREYLKQTPKNLEALSALELISLKLSEFSEASSILSSIDEEKKKPFFKIKTGLNKNLFDVNKAQKNFWESKFESRQSFQYKILFYYAPYRVFDVQQTLNILSEGGVEDWMGNIDEARESYVRGETFSRINRDIAEGLKEVYSGDLREALKILLNNTNSNIQHPILQYNIGLLYAQLGDFENAYTHFAKAYYLDGNDLLSGIFAIMTGKLIYQDVSKISELIEASFVDFNFKDASQRTFMHRLFIYASGRETGGFDAGDEKKPIHVALQAVDGIVHDDLNTIKKAFIRLKDIYPNDLTTELMHQISQSYGQDLKAVSLQFSELFRRGSFSNMHSLYYGGSLTRELYIYLAFVTGNLSFAITHLQENLSNQEGSPIGTMQALGLAYIYNQEFEKAFAVYNDLIDNLKENDTKTKFLGAVAAIGAGHHNNAVALLQISKLDSIATLESRYALALLYQQTGNLKSAINLLLSIGNKGFVSEFFDFEIDSSEILQKAIE